MDIIELLKKADEERSLDSSTKWQVVEIEMLSKQLNEKQTF